MNKLTRAQKNVINEIMKSELATNIYDLTVTQYEKLVSMNDYENLWNDTNRYMMDEYHKQQVTGRNWV